jgi:hypothetical protein
VQYLPLEAQVARLPFVAPYILDAFRRDSHPEVTLIEVAEGIPPGS